MFPKRAGARPEVSLPLAPEETAHYRNNILSGFNSRDMTDQKVYWSASAPEERPQHDSSSLTRAFAKTITKLRIRVVQVECQFVRVPQA